MILLVPSVIIALMYFMFADASAFNQDIGGWAVDSDTTIELMFAEATAFNQDLGWCVVDGVFDPNGYGSTVQDAFASTMCEVTSCGVTQGNCPTPAPVASHEDSSSSSAKSYSFSYEKSHSHGGSYSYSPYSSSAKSYSYNSGYSYSHASSSSGGYVMTDSNIYTARDAWLADATAAEATYGHISTWDTSGVTDMSELFCSSANVCYFHPNSDAASFNEDIGAWDTSGVTTMYLMFGGAAAFNQDIGGWAVHSVENMGWTFANAAAFNQDIGGWALDSVMGIDYIFYQASSFDQNLGWCLDAGVTLSSAFTSTPCESTSCGVTQGNCQP